MLNLVVLYNTGVTNFLLLENLAQQLLGQPCIALTGGGNTAVVIFLLNIMFCITDYIKQKMITITDPGTSSPCRSHKVGW